MNHYRVEIIGRMEQLIYMVEVCKTKLEGLLDGSMLDIFPKGAYGEEAL